MTVLCLKNHALLLSSEDKLSRRYGVEFPLDPVNFSRKSSNVSTFFARVKGSSIGGRLLCCVQSETSMAKIFLLQFFLVYKFEFVIKVRLRMIKVHPEY